MDQKYLLTWRGRRSLDFCPLKRTWTRFEFKIFIYFLYLPLFTSRMVNMSIFHFSSKFESQISSYKQDADFNFLCYVTEINLNQTSSPFLLIHVISFMNTLSQFISFCTIPCVEKMVMLYFAVFINKKKTRGLLK